MINLHVIFMMQNEPLMYLEERGHVGDYMGLIDYITVDRYLDEKVVSNIMGGLLSFIY